MEKAAKAAENTTDISERRESDRVRIHSLSALYEKEMADHIHSRRFIIILLIVAITTIASIYGAVSGMADAISSDSNFIFLKTFTTSGNSIPSYVSLMALVGPLIGLMLGFDAVNSERSSGTLNRLVAQPIYRDSIIIGKFLAGTTLISVLVLVSGILTGVTGFLFIGMRPESEEVGRMIVYLFYTIVYISFWLALSILFSIICRHSATSALSSFAVWLFLAIFMSMIAGVIARSVYPINNQYQQAMNSVNYYNLNLALNRISPYYLYSEAVSTILNPSVRALNAVTMSQLTGAISSYLSMSQSIMLVLPNLVGLVAEMLAAFVLSYIGFMRQEIRGI